METHHIPLQHRGATIPAAFEQDLALMLLNGRKNLTIRQQQMFAHLVLKSLGSAGKSEREIFGWCTSGDLDQDCEELAQVLFSQTV